MRPERVRRDQPGRELKRLQRRSHGDVADEPVEALPGEQQPGDEHQRVACRAQRRRTHASPRRLSKTFSQRDSAPLTAIDRSRINRISGYMVALSKLL